MPVSQINSNSLASGVPARSNLPVGSVLQVVSTTKTDTFSTTSTAFTDITGLSVSITPTSATSKMFITATFQMSQSSTAALAVFNLVRNSTNLSQPSTTPNFNGTAGGYTPVSDNIIPVSITFLDSPATTSATTYKVQARTNSATMYVSRRDSNDCAFTATITVMEIAA